MSSSSFSDLLPSTTDRVPDHIDHNLTEGIQPGTDTTIASFAVDPGLIDLRLQELNREWDVERALEANAAVVALIGLVLGRLLNRRWYLLPTAVAAFLLQHALQGWCPPVNLFRRFGVRTQREIDEERYALQLMQGKVDTVDRQRRKPVDEVMKVVSR